MDLPVIPDWPIRVLTRHRTLISEFSGGVTLHIKPVIQARNASDIERNKD